MIPLDWIAASVTLVSVELTARRKWYGFALGAANGLLWSYLMWRARLWGIVVLEVVYIGQCIWAVRRWRRAAQKKDLDVLPAGWYES